MSSLTVFVLGAGASKEVGLPIGSELTKEIASLLDLQMDSMGHRGSGDPVIYDAVSNHAAATDPVRPNINPYFHAARQIREAMPLASSIDEFINARRGDKLIELCGKLAIVRSILTAEKHSKLFADPRKPQVDQDSLRATWFNAFWKLFSNGCTVDDLQRRGESVAFVIFNYDRCIEQFLYHAVQTYYNLDAQRAATIISRVQFYHPYGSVGSLPWMQETDPVDFGHESSAVELLAWADHIKTFTEGTDPETSPINSIRTVLLHATRLVFLGFAFHPQNLKLLWPKTPDRRITPAVFGTAKTLSNDDVAHIIGYLQSTARVSVGQRLHDCACKDLFHTYNRRLSFVDG